MPSKSDENDQTFKTCKLIHKLIIVKINYFQKIILKIS